MVVGFVSLTLDIYQIAQFRKTDSTVEIIWRLFVKRIIIINTITVGASHFVLGP